MIEVAETPKDAKDEIVRVGTAHSFERDGYKFRAAVFPTEGDSKIVELFAIGPDGEATTRNIAVQFPRGIYYAEEAARIFIEDKREKEAEA